MNSRLWRFLQSIAHRGGRSLCGILVACLFVQSSHLEVARGDVWPRFRGENGTGIVDLKGLPTQWEQDDYEWNIDLPGVGHSSPVVWNDARIPGLRDRRWTTTAVVH